MGKKMITFLGVGNYSRGIYSFEGKPIRETNFVQTALTQNFQPEEVVVFVTEDSRKKNWTGGKTDSNKDGNEITYPEIPLSEIVEKEFPDISFKPVTINEGQHEDEIWENFSIIQEQILPEDSIILDVTHSFRSIPIVALACIQYVRSLKNTVLEGIYYGAWEAAEQGGDGKKIAPIFDLTLFVELMDWSRSVEDFAKYGQITSLRNLVHNSATNMKQKKIKSNLQGLVEDMDWLNDQIVTCRGEIIYESGRIDSIPNKMKKLKNNITELPKPFAPILNNIEHKIQVFTKKQQENTPNDINRGMGAVKWCLDHDLIQQGYTLLQENLITYFCYLGNLDAKNKHDRKLAAQAAATLERPVQEWGSPAHDNIEVIREIHNSAGKKLLNSYEALSNNRNDINHAGMPSDIKPQKLRNDIENIFNEIQKAMEMEL